MSEEKNINKPNKYKIAFEKRRRKGYNKYIRKRRAEIKKRKEKEKKIKEREKLKKKREREKLKNKRPVGRPKKRGPKKKRKKAVLIEKKLPGRKSLPPFNYKIISCRNGLQNKFIGKYRSIEEAYETFNILKESDENIIFPSVITVNNEIKNSIDEYVLIEKTNSKESVLRNEYGKLVQQVLNKDGWVVIDKYRYRKEELFWVYGYDKKNDRKTFLWIYQNLIISDIENYYHFKRVILYKNKIVIKDDNNKIELVICKHESDAVRMYNKLEEWVKKDKIKQVIFNGDYSNISDRRRKLENELIELTGWKKTKLQMKTTTYYTK